MQIPFKEASHAILKTCDFIAPSSHLKEWNPSGTLWRFQWTQMQWNIINFALFLYRIGIKYSYSGADRRWTIETRQQLHFKITELGSNRLFPSVFIWVRFYVSGEQHLQNVILQQMWLKETGHYNHKTLEIITECFPLRWKKLWRVQVSCFTHVLNHRGRCLPVHRRIFFSTYKRLKIQIQRAQMNELKFQSH